MAYASLHARRRRHPATEAGLWLVWIIARVTGLAVLADRAGRRLRAIPIRPAARAVANSCRRHGQALVTAASATAHRVALRAELAAADLLTGPVPELLDIATARLRRRAGWLLVAGVVLANVAYLAIR